jgi:hypothetical protein
MTTIYVIGDSFSAGAELEDHTFESYKKYNLKNYEEYCVWIDSKEYQNELKSRPNYSKYHAELKRAWPAKLESITNTTIINKAWGGSGSGMWRGKVLLDFLDFAKSNITIDVGIIQITDYNRTCLYNSSDSNIIHYTNLGGYHLSFGSTAEKLFLKSRAMIQDDVGDYFNFLLDLANIKMTLLYNGVKTVKIVGSCAKINHIVNQNNYESKIIEINNLLNFLEIDFSKMLYLGKNTDVRLPGGHFNELAHERFALEMKNLLNL